MPEDTDTLTSAQAATLLGVSARQARYLKDDIGYTKVGFLLIFSRAAVVAFAAARGYELNGRRRTPGGKQKRRRRKPAPLGEST